MDPEQLRYSKEHEWITLEDEVRTIGITHHAQVELGDIVYLEIPEVGAVFRAGEAFGTVESVKAVSEIICPVGGEVVEVNTDLRERPEGINEDPYGKGWMIRLRISDPSEVDRLMNASEYGSYVEKAGR